MPHVNSSGGDDLASTDEVKVYKDEGEEEKRSSENLSEDKLGLVNEEEEKQSDLHESRGTGHEDGKPPDPSGPDRPGVYHLFAPYAYPNGATLPGSLYGLMSAWKHKDGVSIGSMFNGNKVPVVQAPHPAALPLSMLGPPYNGDHMTSPPPAHMGIPPVHIDPKTGLPRPPMYSLPPPGQFPHPLYSPEFTQMQWNSPTGYPITTAGFRGPYPSTLTNSALARFSPPGLLPPHPGMHPGVPHPAIVTPGPKQEIPSHTDNHRHPMLHHDQTSNASDTQSEVSSPKRPHIKKPLNAFMLFMKEMRAKVAAECTLKESAAINQILGRRWHALDRSEQAKYYEMARKEKELHLQLYPGWSARDNYASHNKKKKRKRETTESKECTNPKKCRARFGLDQQNQWCKPCRSENDTLSENTPSPVGSIDIKQNVEPSEL